MVVTGTNNSNAIITTPAPTTTTTTTTFKDPPPEEASAGRAFMKRYDGLSMVRTKALRGKGAWYWAHLEPLLVHDETTGQPKAVKLKCCLCDAVFSASNPSRTATEHLKRGTCTNFTTLANTCSSPPPAGNSPRPLASVSPRLPNCSNSIVIHHAAAVDPPQSQSNHHRKRRSSSSSGGGVGRGNSNANNAYQSYHHVSPITTIEPTQQRYCHEIGFSSPTPSPVAASTPAAAPPPPGVTGSGYPHSQHQPRHHHHQQQQHQLVLSGGKEDWGALAMLKDSVKRLKSPKTSPGPALTKSQIDTAFDCFADWVYQSCGSIPFSSLEHPKLKSFLTQVGLPLISARDFAGPRLDAKYEELKAEAEAKIRDAMFFQISSDGWRTTTNSTTTSSSSSSLVSLTVNLPNGTSVFRGAVLTPAPAQVPSKYAEEVLWETIGDVNNSNNNNNNNGGSSSSLVHHHHHHHRCVGIVADRFKNKALRNLENQHPWMVNLSCQYHGILALIKDLYRELPLFRSVAEKCRKVVDFVNNNTHLRNSFRNHRLREYGNSALLRSAPSISHTIDHDDDDNDRGGGGGGGGFIMMRNLNSNNNITPPTPTPASRTKKTTPTDFDPVLTMIEDVIGSIRALQSLLLDDDDAYKIALMEHPLHAREFADTIRADSVFWTDLESVRTLTKLIKQTAHEVDTEKPLVGQCLPIWEDLRTRVKNTWTSTFNNNCGGDNDDDDSELKRLVHVDNLIQRRFKKNYHPAWAAAYILDPLYLIRDASGKYLPPFKHLTPQQEKDVDKLITRLVPREEAHVALMELMKWRTEGLDPDYAQAVQLRQRDPVTGKMKIAIPQSSRLVWETYLTEFKSLAKVAVRLIFLHATARGFPVNDYNNNYSPAWLRPSSSASSSLSPRGGSMQQQQRLHKMMFVAANLNLKLDRIHRLVTTDVQHKDADFFAAASTTSISGNNGDHGDNPPPPPPPPAAGLNEVFVDSSSSM